MYRGSHSKKRTFGDNRDDDDGNFTKKLCNILEEEEEESDGCKENTVNGLGEKLSDLMQRELAQTADKRGTPTITVEQMMVIGFGPKSEDVEDTEMLFAGLEVTTKEYYGPDFEFDCAQDYGTEERVDDGEEEEAGEIDYGEDEDEY